MSEIAEPDTAKRPRILVAEDEQVVALDVQAGLNRLGYDVVGVASSAPQAVYLAEQTCPDLVLMDIRLDGPTDGIDAADEIRRRWQIPVVFVTANTNEEILARATAAAPYGYVTKPFRAKDLNATVAMALHRSHLTRERERDLTELERSNSELGRFSQAVSHDLQAPVRNVRTLADLLSRRLESRLSVEESEILSLIVNAAEGMQRLIQDLLLYAQAGHGELTRETFSSSDALAEVQRTLATSIAETNAEIVSGPLPEISANPVQFRQLLQNLVANAIKYNRPGEPPRITISAETTEDGWHFTVRDNGCGIPLEQRHKIFEPLKRLHGAEIPGSGMGLALCYAIAERHGGRIWAESGADGCGTAFHFVLAHANRAIGVPA